MRSWLAVIICALGAPCSHGQQLSHAELLRTFASPPGEARPMMRWWWFGPAVADAELSRELRVMEQAGIGGVEIQPVYPLALDDPARGIQNLPYLSPPFLDAVRFANNTASALHMRVDITLGSGWPYGGPGTTLALAAGRLKLVELAATGASMPLPKPAEGDTLIAAFTVPGAPGHWLASAATQIPVPPGATALPSPAAGSILLFYASHTLQQVKRPAVGAEGLVLDHFARRAIDEHLRDVADKLASAFGDTPPYSVFSDSLEVYGSDWTPNLPAEFERHRGYDLVPHLPELWAGGSAQSEAVRQDWGRTLSELIRENYLEPLNTWAAAHHTLFRSQTYGEPAVTLSDQATAALPEGEGPQWRQFSFTRWATSASHLYHRPVTSAETFTWLHSPAFRATPLNMKVEADRMFLMGVNQVVGHGWPYTPPGVAEPGWSLYAAAVFDDHNPWFPVMPEVARYLQRASWLLRQGEPANDVAILLPEADAQAAFAPGHVSVTDEMKQRIPPELMQAVLDAGYNVDYVDAESLGSAGVPYPILILPPTRRMALQTARLLQDYAAHGGHIFAIGEVPTLAPGLREQVDSPAVAAVVESLFRTSAAVRVVSLAALPGALHRALAADLEVSARPEPGAAGNDANAGLGFIHRRIAGAHPAEIYFVVNSSSHPLTTTLRFRDRHASMTVLSLDTGEALEVGNASKAVTFEPYESRVFLLDDGGQAPAGRPLAGGEAVAFSRGWTITFPGAAPRPLDAVRPWNELPGRQFFSGQAIYSNSFDLDAAPGAADALVLDFGPGTPTTDTRKPGSNGIHALLDPPIREAAIVYVNGQRAGALWHPPYTLGIGALARRGANKVEIHVYNTALNELASRPQPDYTALAAKYGKRFEPQDLDQVRPLPSGLLAAPTLRRRR